MPRLLLRDLPQALHERLKVRAAQNGHTMSQEAVILLEHALLKDEVARRDPPVPFEGRFAIDNAWLDDAKRSGRQPTGH